MTAQRKGLDDGAIRNLLQERGVRVTEQRMILMRQLVGCRHPVSHAELAAELASAGLDRATVYRNLLGLTESGLLVRTQLGDGVWRYELPAGKTPQHDGHPHFVCTECGGVACISVSEVAFRGKVTKNEILEVQLKGRCGACRS